LKRQTVEVSSQKFKFFINFVPKIFCPNSSACPNFVRSSQFSHKAQYCGDELDPKGRTLLDYHPVEVARQSAEFVLVRPSELMSRAWMKDAGRRARARLPEHQAHHQTSSTASAAGWRRK
jgi:hypothetical protein